jgi:hypothetical protein
MIFIYNLITLGKYIINKCVGCIEFEYINNEYDDGDELCNCTLCYTFENIILFTTRRLKYN